MWWGSKQRDKKLSLFRMPSRRGATAEAPLRIGLTSSPIEEVGELPVIISLPGPVENLTSGFIYSPDAVTAINLSSAPIQPVEGFSTERNGNAHPKAVGGTGDLVESARDEGPSLVDRLRILLAAPLNTLLPGPETVLEWPGDLMPFQRDGVRTLISSDRLLLADDMGLGKTLQVIAALRILCIRRVIESTLVVVPSSLLDQWRREINKWAPDLRAIIIRGSASDRAWQWTAEVHITLVSYETLRSDFGMNTQAPVRKKIWDVIVADEAQRIKNRNTTSAALKGLQRKRSWALSGTPIENNEEELASLLEFVDHEGLTSTKHYRPGVELLNRHRELQLRRKKSDVLDDLPPKLVTMVKLALNPKQQVSYDKAEREGIVHLKELGAEIRVQHVLGLITHLKQICNADPESGDSTKFEDIKSRLEKLIEQGHRALIFSQYTSEGFGVAAVANALQEFHPLTLSGDMSQSQRTNAIESFKSNERHKALVLSLRAGGVGLNLQEASYVFHLDRWWNPAVERQAEDRSHRFGQTVKVHVIKYNCIGTIEERIDEILERKQDLFDKLVDDVSLDIAKELNSGELFGLFGLDVPSSGKTPGGKRPPGLELEDRCAALLEARGWYVARTPLSRDGGVDLIGSKTDEVGIEQQVFVQCKDHALPVGVQVVRELIGVLPQDRNVVAVLASPSGITADAKKAADDRNVIIWDERRLSEMEGLSNSEA